MFKDKSTRREFLSDLGAAAGAVASIAIGFPFIVAACAPLPTELHGLDRFIAEIDSLPSSAIKDGLKRRIVPYFNRPTPFTVNQNGLHYDISNITFDETVINIPQTKGTFSTRGGSKVPNPYQVTADTTLKVPLIGTIINPQDRTGFIQAGQISSDGTPYITNSFINGQQVYDGYAPTISIQLPASSVIKPENKQYYASSGKFVFVKEACSFLLADIITEETYKAMVKLGYPADVPVRGVQGDTQLQTIPQLLNTFEAQEGRYLACLDLGGYFLALKAFEPNKQVFNDLGRDQNVARVMNSIQVTTFSDGTDLNLLSTAYR